MAGTWTAPRTWVDGETPTGAQFNTQFRDNLGYLKDAPVFDGAVVVQGALTANSTFGVQLGANFNSYVNIAGNLGIGGVLTLSGSATLGDNLALDTCTINARVFGPTLQTYSERLTAPVISGGALTLDISEGTYFAVTLNANCAVSILNPPATGRAIGITVIFTADGTPRAVTWPGSVVWASGVAPVMSSTPGKRDLVTLVTVNGGAVWFGVIVGQNY